MTLVQKKKKKEKKNVYTGIPGIVDKRKFEFFFWVFWVLSVFCSCFVHLFLLQITQSHTTSTLLFHQSELKLKKRKWISTKKSFKSMSGMDKRRENYGETSSLSIGEGDTIKPFNEKMDEKNKTKKGLSQQKKLVYWK